MDFFDRMQNVALELKEVFTSDDVGSIESDVFCLQRVTTQLACYDGTVEKPRGYVRHLDAAKGKRCVLDAQVNFNFILYALFKYFMPLWWAALVILHYCIT